MTLADQCFKLTVCCVSVHCELSAWRDQNNIDIKEAVMYECCRMNLCSNDNVTVTWLVCDRVVYH